MAGPTEGPICRDSRRSTPRPGSSICRGNRGPTARRGCGHSSEARTSSSPAVTSPRWSTARTSRTTSRSSRSRRRAAGPRSGDSQVNPCRVAERRTQGGSPCGPDPSPDPRRSVTGLLATFLIPPAGASSGDSLVTIGSPAGHFPNNRQTSQASDRPCTSLGRRGGSERRDRRGPLRAEPPTVGVACPLTNGVGISGVYFSFNGVILLDAADVHGVVGPLRTPGSGRSYAPRLLRERDASHGDPAVGFGPVPGQNGRSPANGFPPLLRQHHLPVRPTPVQVRRRDHRLPHRRRGGRGRGRPERLEGAGPSSRKKGGSSSFNDKEPTSLSTARPRVRISATSTSAGRDSAVAAVSPSRLRSLASTDGGDTWGFPSR